MLYIRCYINYFFFEAVHHPINTPPVHLDLTYKATWRDTTQTHVDF